jgi:pimeloyl-ACP methyl ester carboxylesterase
VAQADAHAALLDALGIEQAAVLGASAGAPSAMQFALRHAERCRALVLLVPAAYVPRADGAPSITSPSRTPRLFDAALRSDFLFWAASHLSRDTFIGSILATPPAVVRQSTSAEQARVFALLDHLLPVSARRLGLVNDAAVVSSLERCELERIDVPTLAISTAMMATGPSMPHGIRQSTFEARNSSATKPEVIFASGTATTFSTRLPRF